MKPSVEILNELKAISQLLAELDKINVFRVPGGYFDELHLRIADYAILNTTSAVATITKRNLQEVPKGYFDTLSNSILARVKAAYPESAEEELRNLSPLLTTLKAHVFSIPEGYFETFAGKVVERITMQSVDIEEAEEELRMLSPLLSTLKTNVFSIPEGYFDSFGKNMLEKLKLQLSGIELAEEELYRISPILSTLKGNVFSVPEGYFEFFGERLMGKMAPHPLNVENAEEELLRISPLLSTLKENVFSLPDGYFESFAADVAQKIQPRGAKVITMKKRNSWWKYAAAAVVTGAIAVGSLQIFNNTPGNNDRRSVVIETGFAEDVKASFQYKTEEDLNTGIARLSDDDIIKYLEKNGNIMDNELLTNDVDVSEMPSPSDYLTDENTLNTYLEKLDAGSTN
ncbi:MAG: hypothetical protein ABI416_15810 [Ginsengibacter sp.]